MTMLRTLSVFLLLLTAVGCQKSAAPAAPPVPPPAPPPVIPVSSFSSGGPGSLLLQVDSSFQLTDTLLPANATDPKLLYTSSNPAIVKPDSTGRLTGLALGTATVTVSSVDNPALFVTVRVAVVNNYTVYVAGYGPNISERKLFLWVNNTSVNLSSGGSDATGMVLSDNGLYIAGDFGSPTAWGIGDLWMDGAETEIAVPGMGPGNSITSLAVSGTKTCFAGYDVQYLNVLTADGVYYNDPISNGWYYTIDGGNIKKTFLDIDTNNINTMPTAIALSGTDVYIAGAFSAGSQIATYWKNDINGAVALATGGDWSEATGIAVSGTDVYVTGYEQCPNYGCIPTAKLWKNSMNSVVNLSDGTLAAQPNCLAIDDTAQFVGGYQQNSSGVKQAMLWRVSGSATYPIVLSNGISDAVVNGITVSGNDVFLAGYQIDPATNLRVATWWRVYGDIVSSGKLPSGGYFGAPDNSEANAIQVR